MELKQMLADTRAENTMLRKALLTARKSVGQPSPRSQELETEMARALTELRIDSVRSPIPRFAQILDRVSLAVSEYDPTLKKNSARHYLAVGASAMEAMFRAAPDLADQPPLNILDLGCGYGRVARFLKAAWPQSALTVCDADFAGLGFCMAHLGLRGFPVPGDPTPDDLGTGYDLIWLGSMVTQLDAPQIRQLITAVTAALAPGGRLFFTTHGDYSARLMRDGQRYDLDERELPALLSSFGDTGFGFARCPGEAGSGVSLTSAHWIKVLLAAVPELRCISHEHRGWAEHLDVVHCVREP